MQFKPIKDVKVYERVIEQIKDMIKSGQLKRGDRLPSERELVEQLQVSRTSIREALSALQMISLIESRHGEGNFIREELGTNFLEPLSILFLLDRSSPWEVLEFRLILEVNSAALAAKKASPDQIKEIRQAYLELEANQLEESQNIELDKQLHYSIARASGNRILYNILNSISDLIDYSIRDTRSRILMDPNNQTILIEQHRGLFEAIAQGDSELAASRMRKHLEFVNECMIKQQAAQVSE